MNKLAEDEAMSRRLSSKFEGITLHFIQRNGMV